MINRSSASVGRECVECSTPRGTIQPQWDILLAGLRGTINAPCSAPEGYAVDGETDVGRHKATRGTPIALLIKGDKPSAPNPVLPSQW